MSEDRLDRIEKIVERNAVAIADLADRIKRLETKVDEMMLMMAQNHAELKTELRRLENKIDSTPDEADQTYGSMLNELADRMTAPEKQVATKS